MEPPLMFLGENPMFYVLRRGAGLQWLEILVICNAPNDGSRNNATPLSGGSASQLYQGGLGLLAAILGLRGPLLPGEEWVLSGFPEGRINGQLVTPSPQSRKLPRAIRCKSERWM
ncbi:hypothetical protein VTI28DRAFT_6802 [Corynascus sepedonium]